MKKHSIFMALAAMLFALCSLPSQAQTGQVRGKVIGQDGQPVVGAQVVYADTSNGRTYKYKTDKKGEYSAIGVQYSSTYEVTITSPSGDSLFHHKGITVGGDPEQNVLSIDLAKNPPPAPDQESVVSSGTGGKTEPPKMTKEELAKYEAAKAQRAKAMNQNAIISQVNAAMTARNYEEASIGLKQLIQMEPNRYEYYSGLGTAQLNLGQYEDAVQTLDKGIQLAQNPTDPKEDSAKAKATIGQMLTNEGNAYLKLKKTNEAVAAYEKAAALDPNPGTAYFNLCATMYNTGNMEGAVGACDKAIAADPTKADAYFIKGSSLYGSGKLDKEGKYVPPPGTAEALNKYLELAPTGSHATDVKAMLDALGAKIETTYHGKKK
ncbi:MAG TPA: tetratricopeptide repeat protein [Candidatus Angelobacter sp.]|jgi:tetratricopeptide (TPR) repeat protein|nr:tetratricopeptide repeat protein [Candidatus Angelobacter sp.]